VVRGWVVGGGWCFVFDVAAPALRSAALVSEGEGSGSGSGGEGRHAVRGAARSTPPAPPPTPTPTPRAAPGGVQVVLWRCALCL
jgi:hypothetical protein